MDPKEIEKLNAGRITDAEIENQFFHFPIQESSEGPIVRRGPENWWSDPREFSTDPAEALKILDTLPEWRTWHTAEGINVQLSVTMMPSYIHITASGLDKSFTMAICKAALMLMAMIKEWREYEKRVTATAESLKEKTHDRK